MAKIAFFETEEWEKSYLKDKLKGNELYFFGDILNEKSASKARDQPHNP